MLSDYIMQFQQSIPDVIKINECQVWCSYSLSDINIRIKDKIYWTIISSKQYCGKSRK